MAVVKAIEVAYVPDCNICDWVKARYDGPTKLGPHGYMCRDCFKEVGIEGSSINRLLYVQRTSHDAGCDQPDAIEEELCPSCRTGPRTHSDVGLWLLARIIVHFEVTRELPLNRQEVLDGLELSGGDWVEITRLNLALAKLEKGHRSGRGDVPSQGRRNRR